MNTRSGRIATPTTAGRVRKDRPVLNKPVRNSKTWYPEHFRYFHVSFTRIHHEEKRVTDGRLTNTDHVRIFNRIFPTMATNQYSHRHLREQWDGRLKKGRSQHWFDVVRPNSKRKDGYTDEDLEEFVRAAEAIQEAADALGIEVPWKNNKFVSGKNEPVSASEDELGGEDTQQIQDNEEEGERARHWANDNEKSRPEEGEEQLKEEQTIEENFIEEEISETGNEGQTVVGEGDEQEIDEAEGEQEMQVDITDDDISAMMNETLDHAENKHHESFPENGTGGNKDPAHDDNHSVLDEVLLAEDPAQRGEEGQDVVMGEASASEPPVQVEEAPSTTPAPTTPLPASSEPLAPAPRPLEASHHPAIKPLVAAMEVDDHTAALRQAEIDEMDHARDAIDVGDPLLALDKRVGEAGAEEQARQRQNARQSRWREPYVYNGSEWIIGGPAFNG